MREKSSSRFFIYAMILAVVLLLEYGPSFHFYFVGDDFGFIDELLQGKMAILWKSRCFYHYAPLGIFINALPAWFGLFEPVWFTLLSFSLFLTCSIFVMSIYRNITQNLTEGFMAALIFLTAMPNSEVIYWKTGNQTIAMTLFSLLALILFMRSLNNGSRGAFFGCLAAFAASILSIEQGVMTFGILVLYDLLFHSFPQFRTMAGDRKRIVAGFLRRFGILASVPIAFTILKLSLGLKLSPFPFSSLSERMLSWLPVETAAKLVDFNNIILSVNTRPLGYSLIAGMSLVFLVYFLAKRNSAGLFFLLSSLGSMLAVSISAGGPNLRYFCLPLAFYACFLSLLLGEMARSIMRVVRKTPAASAILTGRLSRDNGWCERAIYVSVCLAIAYAGFRGNLIRRSFWGSASLIEQNIVESLEDLYAARAFGNKVYLLDVPEDIWTKDRSVFYVCSNSLMPDLRHRLGEDVADRIELAATNNLFEISLGGERVMYRALGRDHKVGVNDIKHLVDSGNLVMRFSPSAMSIVPVDIHNPDRP